jgi:hypothetical protein
MSTLTLMESSIVKTAYNRIKKYINKTPLLQSEMINLKLASKRTKSIT